MPPSFSFLRAYPPPPPPASRWPLCRACPAQPVSPFAATTQNCKYRRRWSISLRSSRCAPRRLPSPGFGQDPPINSRHRGYSDRIAKICGARGAVNKRAISLRGGGGGGRGEGDGGEDYARLASEQTSEAARESRESLSRSSAMVSSRKIRARTNRFRLQSRRRFTDSVLPSRFAESSGGSVNDLIN